MFFQKNRKKGKKSDSIEISWHIDESWKPKIILVDNIDKNDKIESLKYLLKDIISYSEMNDIVQRKNPCDAAFKLMREYYMKDIQYSKDLVYTTFENDLLVLNILLIQNTSDSLTALIRYSFLSMVYDIMMCISYNYKTEQINNEYYRQFLYDLKNGTFLLHETIYTCLLVAHKRLNLKLDEVIEIGMTYLRMNSKQRDTIHADFIQLIGIEHIEVILRKIIENLYTSKDFFYEDTIIKKADVCNEPSSNKIKTIEEKKDESLNARQYIRAKQYYGPYYYITSSVQSFYSDLIMQLNDLIIKVTTQMKYEKFYTSITPSKILFEDKENDISKCTHIIYTPYTKTGKDSKYPLCCYFYIDDKLKPSDDELKRNLFGRIYLLQDNTIGKAKICIWRNHNLLTIDIKKDKNSLIVSKIEQK